MRVILTGGGTGGHIYPAVAIGQAILKEWPQAEILYVGTEKGLETKIVPEAGFNLATIDVVGWQRKISFQFLKAGWKALQGLRQSDRIMGRFLPHLVIGTGGYVCLPVVWAAARRKIPALIHEQNAMPGLTNKFLSRRVNGVMLTYVESARYFPPKMQGKLYYTGLPVRPGILDVSREEGLEYFGFSPDKPVLLGVGGSRGAASINKAMIEVCRQLAGKVQIIHLTGTAGFAGFQQELKAAGIEMVNCGNIIIRPYLHEMEYALACADLCVGRAGAAFLAEITARGIPGILIPYPYAAENHQEFNAKSLVDRGAAVMVRDKEVSGKKLLEHLTRILGDEKLRKSMAENSRKAGNPAAIESIIRVIKKYV